MIFNLGRIGWNSHPMTIQICLLSVACIFCRAVKSLNSCNSIRALMVLTKEHCISILHLIPEDFRKIGAQVVFFNSNGEQHNAHIHGMNSLSDYVVFKKYIGVFTNVPDLRLPGILDQYISLGFAFADRNPSVRVGYISKSLPTAGFLLWQLWRAFRTQWRWRLLCVEWIIDGNSSIE
uniref:Uncharacterized protein n=1 Tax=Ditylenchus dipsaci TaxID=166011 RepID=A0A915EQ60_9BILA